MMMNLINIIVKKLIIEIETVLNLRGFGDCLDEEDGDFEETRPSKMDIAPWIT